MAIVGKISIAMEAQTAKFKAGLKSAQSSLNSFGQAATSTSSLVAGAFTAALGAASAVGFGKMVTAASDLNENMGKTEDIFGKASSKIVDYTSKMAEAFGAS